MPESVVAVVVVLAVRVRWGGILDAPVPVFAFLDGGGQCCEWQSVILPSWTQRGSR